MPTRSRPVHPGPVKRERHGPVWGALGAESRTVPDHGVVLRDPVHLTISARRGS
jgi:hypothetical protein